MHAASSRGGVWREGQTRRKPNSSETEREAGIAARPEAALPCVHLVRPPDHARKTSESRGPARPPHALGGAPLPTRPGHRHRGARGTAALEAPDAAPAEVRLGPGGISSLPARQLEPPRGPLRPLPGCRAAVTQARCAELRHGTGWTRGLGKAQRRRWCKDQLIPAPRSGLTAPCRPTRGLSLWSHSFPGQRKPLRGRQLPWKGLSFRSQVPRLMSFFPGGRAGNETAQA